MARTLVKRGKPGDRDEALRIRREEELPVYEKLGDVRSRALCLGKTADILEKRGEFDAALALRREELPVYLQLQDMRNAVLCLQETVRTLVKRNKPGDRDEALEILKLLMQGASDAEVEAALNEFS